MSELIYCPECGHPKWDKDHFNCTYESLVGEASTPPELQLLVIDLGDSCVVKVEQGAVNIQEVQLGPINTDSLYRRGITISELAFTQLRSAIDGEKPVPRIERHNSTGLSVHYTHRFDGTNYENIGQDAYAALSELAGKPLPIWTDGTWEDLLPKKGLGWELPLGIWRYTR